MSQVINHIIGTYWGESDEIYVIIGFQQWSIFSFFTYKKQHAIHIPIFIYDRRIRIDYWINKDMKGSCYVHSNTNWQLLGQI